MRICACVRAGKKTGNMERIKSLREILKGTATHQIFTKNPQRHCNPPMSHQVRVWESRASGKGVMFTSLTRSAKLSNV